MLAVANANNRIGHRAEGRTAASPSASAAMKNAIEAFALIVIPIPHQSESRGVFVAQPENDTAAAEAIRIATAIPRMREVLD